MSRKLPGWVRERKANTGPPPIGDAEPGCHRRERHADAEGPERTVDRLNRQDTERREAEDHIGKERHGEPHRGRAIAGVIGPSSRMAGRSVMPCGGSA